MSKRGVDKSKIIWTEFNNLIVFGRVDAPEIFEFEGGDEDGEHEEMDDKKSLNNFQQWLAKRDADELNQPNKSGETMLMFALDYEKFTIAAELRNAGGDFNKNGEALFWRSFEDDDRVRRVRSGFNAELKEIRKKSAEKDAEEAAEEAAEAVAPRFAKPLKFVEPKRRKDVVDSGKLQKKWCDMMGIVPAAAPIVVHGAAKGGGAALAFRDDGAKK